MDYAVILYSEPLAQAIVDVSTAVSAAAAVERALADPPTWARARFVAVYEAPVYRVTTVQDMDLVYRALAEGRPPPVGRPLGPGVEAWTVAAYWKESGETLVHDSGGGHVRAANGLEALARVAAGIAPASELQVVAAIAGHKRPVLTALAGTAPLTLGPPINPTRQEIGA